MGDPQKNLLSTFFDRRGSIFTFQQKEPHEGKKLWHGVQKAMFIEIIIMLSSSAMQQLRTIISPQGAKQQGKDTQFRERHAVVLYDRS